MGIIRCDGRCGPLVFLSQIHFHGLLSWAICSVVCTALGLLLGGIRPRLIHRGCCGAIQTFDAIPAGA